MEPFKKVKSIVAPLDKVNVDTDQIVPKQFLKLIHKTGFGRFLFYNWRFDENGNPKSDFMLNDPKYTDSKILVTQDNFGCGSSREHAVWAIKDYGFSVVIAPSFADIFYSNCFKNGVLPIKLDSKTVDELLQETSEIEIDLESQRIKTKTKIIPFEIEGHRKKNLLKGLDEIALTLEHENKISDYEKRVSVPSLL